MEIQFRYTKPRIQKPTFFVAQVLRLFEKHFDRVDDLSYRIEIVSIFDIVVMKRENARIRTNRETS
jgi:hypothetical protein